MGLPDGYFARRLNRQTGATGHVWEGRYHDVALIDAGGVLAALVYVDLNVCVRPPILLSP